jgi:site-specific recombinase XerD
MVYTIGYGNRLIDTFISLLKEHDIKRVYDIRTYPRSRWQVAYNKASFAKRLDEHRIEYIHKKNLGGKDIELLDKEIRTNDLNEIAQASKEMEVAIMCSELSLDSCHRKGVAEELEGLGAQVEHIGKDGTAKPPTQPPQLILKLEETESMNREQWRDQAKDIFDGLDVSESTRREYRQRVGLFFDYAEQNVVGRNIFLDFKRFLADRDDFSVSTKNKYLIVARIFLKELHRLGYLPIDVTQTTKSFAQSKLHKREGLNSKEMKQLSEMLTELPNSPLNVRLKALFCLLAFQGLRQIEIIRLDVQDVDLVRKVAFVRGKGRDDKELVHLHSETLKYLKMYLKVAKVAKVASGAIFRSLGNRKSERITTMTVKREIKRLMSMAGIDKPTHGFRHYFITALLEKLDVRDVRKFSRHRSLEMLIVYDDEMDISRKAVEVFKCFDDFVLNKTV